MQAGVRRRAVGERVTVVEEDDGSGWLKVAGASGRGLVPASYLAPAGADSSPAAGGGPQGCGRFGEHHHVRFFVLPC